MAVAGTPRPLLNGYIGIRAFVVSIYTAIVRRRTLIVCINAFFVRMDLYLMPRSFRLCLTWRGFDFGVNEGPRFLGGFGLRYRGRGVEKIGADAYVLCGREEAKGGGVVRHLWW